MASEGRLWDRPRRLRGHGLCSQGPLGPLLSPPPGGGARQTHRTAEAAETVQNGGNTQSTAQTPEATEPAQHRGAAPTAGHAWRSCDRHTEPASCPGERRPNGQVTLFLSLSSNGCKMFQPVKHTHRTRHGHSQLKRRPRSLPLERTVDRAVQRWQVTGRGRGLHGQVADTHGHTRVLACTAPGSQHPTAGHARGRRGRGRVRGTWPLSAPRLQVPACLQLL